MFDFAWSEILLIGAVALIAIGPKDMPAAIRTVSGMIKKARRMAAEFQTHVDEMVREADLGDVKKTFNEIRNFDIPERCWKSTSIPTARSASTFADDPFKPTYPDAGARFRPWTRSRSLAPTPRAGSAAGDRPAGAAEPPAPGRTAGVHPPPCACRPNLPPPVNRGARHHPPPRRRRLIIPGRQATAARRPISERLTWQDLKTTRSTTSRCRCWIT